MPPLRFSRAFVLRRLHSLSGVVPLGAFLVLHLLSQSSASSGRDAYVRATTGWLTGAPLLALEVLLVFLPLAFHAAMGARIALASRPTVVAHPTNRSWMHLAQRLSGAAVLVWIVWHLGETWVPRVLGRIGPDAWYSTLASELSSTMAGLPLRALVYVAGIGAASFHLSNGLWGAGVTWGLWVTKRSQSIASAFAVLIGLALFGLGTSTTLFFATGSRVLPPSPPPAAEASPLCEPPAPPSRTP